MIVRLSLPERHSGAFENPVRGTGGSSLEPSHDVSERGLWFDDYMDVIGHDDPGV